MSAPEQDTSIFSKLHRFTWLGPQPYYGAGNVNGHVNLTDIEKDIVAEAVLCVFYDAGIHSLVYTEDRGKTWKTVQVTEVPNA